MADEIRKFTISNNKISDKATLNTINVLNPCGVPKWSIWFVPAAAREVLAREFDLTDQAIRNWVKQVDQDQGRCEDGLTTEGRKAPDLVNRDFSDQGSKYT